MSRIEKGVRMPGCKPNARYHFEDMEVGDSIFFMTLKEVENAQSSAYSWACRNNDEFRVARRKVDGGYRLWRIK